MSYPVTVSVDLTGNEPVESMSWGPAEGNMTDSQELRDSKGWLMGWITEYRAGRFGATSFPSVKTGNGSMVSLGTFDSEEDAKSAVEAVYKT